MKITISCTHVIALTGLKPTCTSYTYNTHLLLKANIKVMVCTSKVIPTQGSHNTVSLNEVSALWSYPCRFSPFRKSTLQIQLFTSSNSVKKLHYSQVVYARKAADCWLLLYRSDGFSYIRT